LSFLRAKLGFLFECIQTVPNPSSISKRIQHKTLKPLTSAPFSKSNIHKIFITGLLIIESKKLTAESLFLTPERLAKFQKVLSQKQPGLAVVLENVHDPHNISAVLRTCDAVGILDVYIVHPPGEKPKPGKKSSASAYKWLRLHYFTNAADCCKELKEKKFKILSTHLSADSSELYELNLCEKVALVFGNEHRGVSEEMLKLSDGNFKIPQVGMLQSLNISVACAVSLYEAFRQREKEGLYSSQQLTQAEAGELLEKWSER
jgi:tRNA (guanosine-2'-O-)-methyltransferase